MTMGTKAAIVHCPCLGITAEHDPCVPTFITRTGAGGGGACAVSAIADKMFGKAYAALRE
jgi:hypothetical protein